MPLYTYIDPLDLPIVSPQALLEGMQDGVVLEPGGPRQSVRPPPAFHDDPDGAGLFTGFGPLTFTTPPGFLTVTRKGGLTGYRMSLGRDGRCFHDEALGPDGAVYVEKLARSDAFPNEETGLTRMKDGRFKLEARGRARVRIEGAVVVLCAGEPYNFGSFLFRVLPKLHAVRAFGLGHLPVLVHAHAPTQLQYLNLADMPQALIRQHDTCVLYALDHAIRPSMRNAHGFIDAQSRAVFAGLRQRVGAGENKRLYVSRLGHSRRGASSRVMTNEALLVARLAGLGFRIIEPEAMSAAAQIEAFAGADLVVGPSGAGMFNAVFCQPGTRVIDIESEPHWIHAHSCLLGSAGLEYGVIEGKVEDDDPHSVHRRWRVNIEAVCDRITDFAAPGRRTPKPSPQGSLDLVTSAFAAGWARDPAQPGVVLVDIRVDGTPVGQIQADQPRDDLGALGACAFRFVFAAPIPAGAQVSARIAASGHDLAHSPRLAC